MNQRHLLLNQGDFLTVIVLIQRYMRDIMMTAASAQKGLAPGIYRLSLRKLFRNFWKSPLPRFFPDRSRGRHREA